MIREFRPKFIIISDFWSKKIPKKRSDVSSLTVSEFDGIVLLHFVFTV